MFPANVTSIVHHKQFICVLYIINKLIVVEYGFHIFDQPIKIYIYGIPQIPKLQTCVDIYRIIYHIRYNDFEII